MRTHPRPCAQPCGLGPVRQCQCHHNEQARAAAGQGWRRWRGDGPLAASPSPSHPHPKCSMASRGPPSHPQTHPNTTATHNCPYPHPGPSPTPHQHRNGECPGAATPTLPRHRRCGYTHRLFSSGCHRRMCPPTGPSHSTPLVPSPASVGGRPGRMVRPPRSCAPTRFGRDRRCRGGAAPAGVTQVAALWLTPYAHIAPCPTRPQMAHSSSTLPSPSAITAAAAPGAGLAVASFRVPDMMWCVVCGRACGWRCRRPRSVQHPRPSPLASPLCPPQPRVMRLNRLASHPGRRPRRRGHRYRHRHQDRHRRLRATAATVSGGRRGGCG